MGLSSKAAYRYALEVSIAVLAQRLAAKDGGEVDGMGPVYRADLGAPEAGIQHTASSIDEHLLALAEPCAPNGLKLIKEMVAKWCT